MSETPQTEQCASRVLDRDGLGALVETLVGDGFRVIGPRPQEGVLELAEIVSADELPWGFGDLQEPATYRLERRDDDDVFSSATTPQAWKAWLRPARTLVWRARHEDGVPVFEEEPPPDRPLALLGVRACDVASIGIQDTVLLHGRYPERDYAVRRHGAFVVAVDCGTPAGTCFCTSLDTGPRVGAGADLVLTETRHDGHVFVVRAGTERGAALLARLPGRDATAADDAAARAVTDRAAERMGRHVDLTDVHDLLLRNLESGVYDDVAERCLTCGNCTLACPTCFCSSIDDVTALDGSAEAWRRWDTCFSLDYSYIHGGGVRQAPRARYRQWLTHKFATWIDQFGSSGCVGCGRCITWCPVGIDVTEEIAAIRAADGEVEDAHAR